MNTTKQERELFQSEYMKLPSSVSRQYLVRHALDSEKYQYESVQIAWELWQARAAQSSSRTEKDLIIELAVLEGKYAAVCDELESLSKLNEITLDHLEAAFEAFSEDIYLDFHSNTQMTVDGVIDLKDMAELLSNPLQE